MGPHVASVLGAGASVVLDFQANMVEARKWMRDILDWTDASHILRVMGVPYEVCLAFQRNIDGSVWKGVDRAGGAFGAKRSDHPYLEAALPLSSVPEGRVDGRKARRTLFRFASLKGCSRPLAAVVPSGKE